MNPSIDTYDRRVLLRAIEASEHHSASVRGSDICSEPPDTLAARREHLVDDLNYFLHLSSRAHWALIALLAIARCCGRVGPPGEAPDPAWPIDIRAVFTESDSSREIATRNHPAGPRNFDPRLANLPRFYWTPTPHDEHTFDRVVADVFAFARSLVSDANAVLSDLDDTADRFALTGPVRAALPLCTAFIGCLMGRDVSALVDTVRVVARPGSYALPVPSVHVHVSSPVEVVARGLAPGALSDEDACIYTKHPTGLADEPGVALFVSELTWCALHWERAQRNAALSPHLLVNECAAQPRPPRVVRAVDLCTQIRCVTHLLRALGKLADSTDLSPPNQNAVRFLQVGLQSAR